MEEPDVTTLSVKDDRFYGLWKHSLQRAGVMFYPLLLHQKSASTAPHSHSKEKTQMLLQTPEPLTEVAATLRSALKPLWRVCRNTHLFNWFISADWNGSVQIVFPKCGNINQSLDFWMSKFIFCITLKTFSMSCSCPGLKEMIVFTVLQSYGAFDPNLHVSTWWKYFGGHTPPKNEKKKIPGR